MEKAIEALKNGGVILYPTDTIWGIGCDATNEEACQKIMEIKNRPAEKSFIVLVDSVPMLERYIPEIADVCYELIDYSEKPLTIIYENPRGLAPSLLAADGTIGIRVTKDPICQKLIRSMRKPLVSTSANLSGQPSPSYYADISPELKAKMDAIVEEKMDQKGGRASQIIKIGLDSSVTIIRK